MWGITNTGIKRQVVDKIRNRFNLSSLSLVYFALFKLVQYKMAYRINRLTNDEK